MIDSERLAVSLIAEADRKSRAHLSLRGLSLSVVPPDIGKLNSLTTLDLSDNRISHLPDAIGNLSSLTALSINKNPLTSLPSAIGQLSELRRLQVNGNKLKRLPEELGNLQKLRSISLKYNQLVELPWSLGRLSQLKSLHVSHNALTRIPTDIDNMRSLEQLSASNNRLRTLPGSIGNLSELRQLSLSQNKLVELPETLGRLRSLVQLALQNNRLRSVPDSIGSLPALRQLHISANNLSCLPDSLGNLDQLLELQAYQNDICEIPIALCKLSNLRLLYLSSNRLEKLPDEIQGLTNLERLSLGHNRLVSVPTTIGRLSRLAQLALDHNQLTEIPQAMRNLPALKQLLLHSNPLLNIPLPVLGPDWDEITSYGKSPSNPYDILDYYFSSRIGSHGLDEVKVLIVGRGDAGKSSIRDRLFLDTFDLHRKETPGIQINQWALDCPNGQVRVHVWDFAGQEITHATHQLFLTERSVYLLVLDARADTQDMDAEYWLRLIATFGEDSPVIVCLNKFDAKPFEIDEFALQERFPSIRAFIKTDCQSGRGRDKLLAEIGFAIDGMPSVRERFPAAWVKAKERFGDMEEDYLPFREFQSECADLGEPDPAKQAALARILHALGIILHYGDDPRLRDTTILNPLWVTSNIYTLLRLKEGTGGDGLLTIEDACTALPDEPTEMVTYLLGLMQRFELCFPIGQHGDTWLLPELLSRFQPKLDAEWNAPNSLRLRYDYDVLPQGLIPRFITRTYPLSEDELRWRYGVVLRGGQGKALVRASSGRSPVDAVILGPENDRRRLAKLIRSHFHAIHGDLRGLRPRESIQVSGESRAYADVDALMKDEHGAAESAILTTVGTVSIDHTVELNRISSEAARDEKVPRLKLFLSYAHEDAAFRDRFRQNLDLLCADGLIDPWHDGRILPGIDWDREVRRELEDANIILAMVSPAYLNSDYVRGVEMKRALERAAAGVAQLVSVILEPCRWKRLAFAKYQVILPNGKSVSENANYTHAFFKVEEALAALCEDRLSRSDA